MRRIGIETASDQATLLSGLTADAAGLEVQADLGTRARYAFDASNYRVVPLAVAYPDSTEQVIAAVRVCHERRIPVTCRGGGTSMAGNAIGPGLVLDFSRSFAEVLEVDPVRRRARVRPGVVLDSLQRTLAPYGLMFGPDPSSRRTATLGGMIGNDACGNHSVRYGRTVDSVLELEIVLPDGTHLLAGPGGVRPAGRGDEAVARAEAVNDELRGLARDHLADIRLELDRIPRQVSGYQLRHLLPENGFDVARALVGTEGTCAIVVAATVALVPVPETTRLLALGYADIAAAAEDVPAILGFDPTAVEGLDGVIADTVRARRGEEAVAILPKGGAWLLVELDGPPERSAELLDRLHADVHLVEGREVTDLADRAALWRVREDGAGLATRGLDDRQTWGGWEDAAVAPERLPEYLRAFGRLLDEHGLTGVLYGHFGAGCVHARIDFDLATEPGIARMREFVRAAAALVRAYDGSLSGEHGDGRARGELLAVMYGPEILGAFARMKDVFDPDRLLAPGIIVDPAPVGSRIAALPMAARADGTVFAYTPEKRGFAGAISRCVGVGRCRSDTGGAMCPSYRATHREEDSTRGRARMLQEMVRGDLVTGGWRSAEVRDALDLCLSCKACVSDCPTGVDLATYKAEFLHHHYRRRFRPRTHYSLGWLPLLATAAGLAPALANALARRRAVIRLGGVTEHRALPAFTARTAWRRGLAKTRSANVLFVDTFTRAFRPELAAATSRVLTDAGASAAPVSGLCCGLTWVTTGQLGVARRILKRTVRRLDRTGDGTIVVMEPSCASALRDDLPELVPGPAAERVAGRVRGLAEVLGDRLDDGWDPPPVPAAVTLQTHCHEQAGPGSPSRLLRRLGVGEIKEAGGCCGLAGNFGFERGHYDVSMRVAELSLAPLLGETAARPVVADGFSCQTQIRHISPERRPEPLHLAQLVDRALASRRGHEPSSALEETT